MCSKEDFSVGRAISARALAQSAEDVVFVVRQRQRRAGWWLKVCSGKLPHLPSILDEPLRVSSRSLVFRR